MKFPQDIYANRQLIKLDMPLVWHEESFISQWCVKIYQNPEENKAFCKVFIGHQRLENSLFTTQNSPANVR